MPPAVTCDYTIHDRNADMETAAELVLSTLARLPGFSNHAYGGIIEFGTFVRFATDNQFRFQPHNVSVTKGRTALCGHIVSIVSIGAEKKVLRSDARPIITAVADKETIGNRPISQLVSHTMRMGLSSVLIPSETEHAIAVRVAGSRPNPAIARLVNLRPKALSNRSGDRSVRGETYCRGKIGLHQEPPTFLVPCSGLYQQRRSTHLPRLYHTEEGEGALTKLIVMPLDPKADGSFRERKRLLRVVRQLREAQASGDPVAVVDSMDAVEALVVPRLHTDDGTPIEDALDMLSANDFDQLFGALLGVIDAVPPPSNSSSSSGPEDTAV